MTAATFPKPGDHVKFWHAQWADRYTPRLALVVEDQGADRFALMVYANDADLQVGDGGEKPRDVLVRISGVPFYSGTLRQNRTSSAADPKWEWPGNQFCAWEAPTVVPREKSKPAPSPALEPAVQPAAQPAPDAAYAAGEPDGDALMRDLPPASRAPKPVKSEVRATGDGKKFRVTT